MFSEGDDFEDQYKQMTFENKRDVVKAPELPVTNGERTGVTPGAGTKTRYQDADQGSFDVQEDEKVDEKDSGWTYEYDEEDEGDYGSVTEI